MIRLVEDGYVAICDWCGAAHDATRYLMFDDKDAKPAIIWRSQHNGIMLTDIFEGRHFCDSGCEQRLLHDKNVYDAACHAHREYEENLLRNIPAYRIMRERHDE